VGVRVIDCAKAVVAKMNKMKKMILIAATKTTLKQARVNLTLIRILRKEENSLL
jgi:hypothetical protein